MAEPPILSSPKPGEVLIMYLAISSIATSATLIREEGKNQHPVFYTSKTMTDAETWYSKAEKIILALVYAKKKLRHYFESHSIVVLTNYPIWGILSKPDLSGRITKWAIELRVGVVISTPEGTKLQQSICLNFPTTNNEAEYEALLAGLRLASSLQLPHVENAEADQLATAASSSNEDLTRIMPIDVLDEPSINPQQEVMVIPVIPREPCWIDPLEAYLKHGTLPNQKTEARKLRLTAAKYAIINNQLYRKSFLGPNLKCLSPTEALVVLKQIHDGDCGNHSGGRSLTHKVLTQGYFWLYLARNAEEYAGRCDKCQRHGPMKHQPAEDLHAMANPWPFAQWGIDMVGPLPKTVEQKEYVLLATDYFTKWVEIEAYSSVTHEQVKNFLWNNIIC
ncbi:uncharacterized protein LOC132305465 [Cornus florida]|uniref:uncharacterized protein LOC132305465 n=1 Tax=Cornus florida TaxID=4283 RepID=UPI00289B3645|nr:uncharacterized protein LOC132305465 [Cornus florida]